MAALLSSCESSDQETDSNPVAEYLNNQANFLRKAPRGRPGPPRPQRGGNVSNGVHPPLPPGATPLRGRGRGRGGPPRFRGTPSQRGRRSREAIRKQLAAESSSPQKESNLSICFVNESLCGSSLVGKKKLSTDSSSEDEANPLRSDDLEKLSAQYIAKNNISRRKNHVIIPLTPSPSNSDFNTSEADPQSLVCANPINPREEPSATSSASSSSSPSAELYFNVGDEASNTFAVYVHKIQVEARKKLKQAKWEAKASLELDRENRDFIAEVVNLLGITLNASKKKCKLNRQILTNLNIAQLQVILNFLLSKIENLNEKLVDYLMVRDELVMEQDSLLTDIEDITKGIASTSIVASD